MTRILVFSDSHGRTENMIKVIKCIPGIDYIIFLGDCLKDIYPIEREFSEVSFHYVPGNNDFSFSVPSETTIEIEGFHFFLTHGHAYQVKTTLDRILYRTEEAGCQICLFGHTHCCVNTNKDGLLLFNPGSISLPYFSKPTYGIIEIENGKISSDIIEVG